MLLANKSPGASFSCSIFIFTLGTPSKDEHIVGACDSQGIEARTVSAPALSCFRDKQSRGQFLLPTKNFNWSEMSAGWISQRRQMLGILRWIRNKGKKNPRERRMHKGKGAAPSYTKETLCHASVHGLGLQTSHQKHVKCWQAAWLQQHSITAWQYE